MMDRRTIASEFDTIYWLPLKLAIFLGASGWALDQTMSVGPYGDTIQFASVSVGPKVGALDH
jgi:hypothetical protein